MSSLIRALFIVFLLPHAGLAQTYPSQSETAVTDDAALIGPVEEAELAQRLTALGQDTGSDIAVVTLPSMAFYTGGDDLDVYARGLMASWALGESVADRAVLLLVFAEDRELRIEVGSGFGPETAEVAADIVTEILVPAFRDEAYARGIADAVDAIAARILTVADPVATTPEPAPPPVAPAAPAGDTGGSGILYWIGGGVAALVALAVARTAGRRRNARRRLAPAAARPA